MSTAVEVVHTLAGRTRLRLPAQRGKPETFAQIARRLSECPGVMTVRFNSLTGSLVLEHTVPLADIMAFARRQGLLTPVATVDAVGSGSAAPFLHRLPEWLRPLTDGDPLRLGLAGLLVLLGCLQVARGQILTPATTLFWYALYLLDVDRRLGEQ